MARKKKLSGGGKVQLDFGTPNPKQQQFLTSKVKYTAYGGARGGGKSWVARVKAAAGGLNYPGIKILMPAADLS